jgi:Kdo2-lipid IVA lauroyltransferase/acyltransferase
LKRRSALRNAAEYGVVRLVLFTLAHTPLPVARRLAGLYTRVLDLAAPRLRRVAFSNLQRALPGALHAAIIEGVFASIARILLSFARFPQLNAGNIHNWIRYEGIAHFEQARAAGRGVLFATGHLGNWELSAFAHGIMTGPMHVVVRPLDNPLIDRIVTLYRGMSGNRIIEKKDYARGILKALAANEAVGILIDQNSSLEEGVFVDFFGIPACSGTGFAKLAARSGASVVPGFAIWSPVEEKYVLRFYPAVPITGDVREDTQRIQATLEQLVREYPDQWLWIHRRWKTRPPGSPPLYP